MKKSLDEIAGRNLKAIRTHKGLSQSDIGRAVAVRQTTISNMEKLGEVSSAKLTTLEEVANFFKIPAFVFLIDNIDITQVDQGLCDLIQAYMELPKSRRDALSQQAKDYAKLARIEN